MLRAFQQIGNITDTKSGELEAIRLEPDSGWSNTLIINDSRSTRAFVIYGLTAYPIPPSKPNGLFWVGPPGMATRWQRQSSAQRGYHSVHPTVQLIIWTGIFSSVSAGSYHRSRVMSSSGSSSNSDSCRMTKVIDHLTFFPDLFGIIFVGWHSGGIFREFNRDL
jgi:hypothetical protein